MAIFHENLPSHTLSFKSVFTNHCSVPETLKSSSFISYVNIKSTALGGACYTSRGLAREGTTSIIKGRGGKRRRRRRREGGGGRKRRNNKKMIDDDDGKVLVIIIIIKK